MKIKAIREYNKDSELELKVAYTPSSDLFNVKSPLSFTVKGKTSVNGVVFDSGTYQIDDIQELVMSIVDGYLIFNGFMEVKTIDDVPQQLPLPDPEMEEEEDYRSIIAIFEKWAHSRGITQDIKTPENVSIDDILTEEDYDMGMPLDDDGLIPEQEEQEEEIYPDTEGDIKEAVKEAVEETQEEIEPIEEPTSQD